MNEPQPAPLAGPDGPGSAALLGGPVAPGPLVRVRPLLVADDDESSLRLIGARIRALRLANPVLTARDGDEAVQALTLLTQEGATAPALVLLDGQMPGRSGIEVLRWIRSATDLRDVPVVLLTADGDHQSIRAAYAAGATSYLIKPVGFSALAQVLRGLECRWMLM